MQVKLQGDAAERDDVQPGPSRAEIFADELVRLASADPAVAERLDAFLEKALRRVREARE